MHPLPSGTLSRLCRDFYRDCRGVFAVWLAAVASNAQIAWKQWVSTWAFWLLAWAL